MCVNAWSKCFISNFRKYVHLRIQYLQLSVLRAVSNKVRRKIGLRGMWTTKVLKYKSHYCHFLNIQFPSLQHLNMTSQSYYHMVAINMKIALFAIKISKNEGQIQANRERNLSYIITGCHMCAYGNLLIIMCKYYHLITILLVITE